MKRLIAQSQSCPGRLTFLLLIGSADKFELHSRLRQIYGSNSGLARARAEWLGNQLRECKAFRDQPRRVAGLERRSRQQPGELHEKPQLSAARSARRAGKGRADRQRDRGGHKRRTRRPSAQMGTRRHRSSRADEGVSLRIRVYADYRRTPKKTPRDPDATPGGARLARNPQGRVLERGRGVGVDGLRGKNRDWSEETAGQGHSSNSSPRVVVLKFSKRYRKFDFTVLRQPVITKRVISGSGREPRRIISRTWLEYFSVASLYGGGQSIRSDCGDLRHAPRWFLGVDRGVDQFMRTRRRRQRNSLPELDSVAVKKYRRAPAESESKNDIDSVEDHLALRSRRWIPHREKRQVERDVDCICVAEVHRVAAHPPDPGCIN